MSDKPGVPPSAPPPVPLDDAIELDPTALEAAQDDTEGGKYDPEAMVARGVSRSVPAVSKSARKPAQFSPTLWLASGLVALTAAGVFAWSAFRAPIQPAPPAPAPISPVREIRAAKIGFSLLVDSKPSGATVFVDGTEVGRTPALLNLHCTPGIDVDVRVERAGYETFTHSGACNTDAILTLKPKLRRLP